MVLRPELHPYINDKGKIFLPPVCFTMSSVDKYFFFFKVIKDVRVPGRYALNVLRCVKLNERTILALTSHDSYILMQQIMPIALCHSSPTKVVKPVIDLSAFLLDICSKALREEDLDRL